MPFPCPGLESKPALHGCEPASRPPFHMGSSWEKIGIICESSSLPHRISFTSFSVHSSQHARPRQQVVMRQRRT